MLTEFIIIKFIKRTTVIDFSQESQNVIVILISTYIYILFHQAKFQSYHMVTVQSC